jgi:hypothetical protein
MGWQSHPLELYNTSQDPVLGVTFHQPLLEFLGRTLKTQPASSGNGSHDQKCGWSFTYNLTKKTWDVTGVSMTTCCGDVIATF